MKYTVSHDGRTKTYVAIRHTANYLLSLAKASREGSLLNLQAASVFYAFAFEAYLNHVGAEELPFWAEIDRISYFKKLNVISKHLGLEADQGKPPFQIIRELFELRNMLAHGRTLDIDVTYETDCEPDDMDSWLIHDWEKLTAEKVDLFATDVTAAIEIINNARHTPDKGFELWNEWGRGRIVRTT